MPWHIPDRLGALEADSTLLNFGSSPSRFLSSLGSSLRWSFEGVSLLELILLRWDADWAAELFGISFLNILIGRRSFWKLEASTELRLLLALW